MAVRLPAVAAAACALLSAGAAFLSTSPAPLAAPEREISLGAEDLPQPPIPRQPLSPTATRTARWGVFAAFVVLIGASRAVASRAVAAASWRAGPARPCSVARLAFENELGVQSPVGFWDPAGFTDDGDVAAFRRRRSVELKHGRITMLACMGYITPELVGKWPGYLSFSEDLKFADIPNGLGALSKVPALGWVQIVAYFGFCEFSGGFDDYRTGTPGDYGWKALTSSDPEEKRYKLNAELANGRLAMFAIMAMLFQNGVTGTTGPEMWGQANNMWNPGGVYAFENEAGVQAPVGFWDPADFTADGDAANFKRRRAVELKHGRVSMYACIGYIVPEYVRFSGELSPSAGLKFADVPNGLAALDVVPFLGWLQIVAFIGLIEKTGFTFTKVQDIGFGQDASMSMTGEPGNYGLGFIGAWNKIPSNPALRARKLNAELANGRLAMTAIMSMLFQNGTTGTTGPEMWWFPPPPEYATTVGDFIPKGI